MAMDEKLCEPDKVCSLKMCFTDHFPVASCLQAPDSGSEPFDSLPIEAFYIIRKKHGFITFKRTSGRHKKP